MGPGDQHDCSPSAATMVDLFAGPGGLDVAARWLGLDAHGVEWDRNAVETRFAAGLSTSVGDVRRFGPCCFPKAEVLAGGPPCQTFTVAGGGAGRRALDRVLGLVEELVTGQDISVRLAGLEDERTGLVLEPLRWALEAYQLGRPFKAIVLEQVPAVLPVWKAVGEALERFGYTSVHGVLRTEEFGVPQTRRRALLVATLDSHAKLPPPTHRKFSPRVSRLSGDSSLLPWKSMADVLGRTGHFIVKSNYGTGGDPKARGVRHSEQPSATVTGKIRRNIIVGPGGDSGGNRLTIAEAGLLQTFPGDYPWAGNDIAQQIGNAIPPRLAAHVLAAALDLRLDVQGLDKAVEGSWATTISGVAVSETSSEVSLALDLLDLIESASAGRA